jgi:hypothetical protein
MGHPKSSWGQGQPGHFSLSTCRLRVLHSCPTGPPALRNNDFAAAEETRIQRNSSGAQQNQGKRNHGHMQGCERIAMPVSVRGDKPCNARRQVANGCRSACERRQKSGQESQPSKDCKKADDANDVWGGARCSKSAETLRDCAQGNRDSQKDEAEAWPSGRESRK